MYVKTETREHDENLKKPGADRSLITFLIVWTRVVVEAGTSETKTETLVAETKTETEAI